MRKAWLFFTRTFLGAYHGFIRNECYLKASALTFYTLLSIVPICAIAFGVAKSLGFEDRLKHEIYVHFRDQQEVATSLINYSYNLLQHAQGGLIAGIGVIFLLWTVFRLLSNIESTLNDIWGVPTARPFFRQCACYLMVVLLLPIFFVAASSLTLFLATELRVLARSDTIMSMMSPLFFRILRLAPYPLSWTLFTFLYSILPNKKIAFRHAALAGVLAGSAYQMLQWNYIHFQIGVSNYGAIYGSFAAVPLFLIWLQVSWLILLFGAEVAHQQEI